MHFASWVTWLEGVIPRASDRMCGLPPAIVSTSWQIAKAGHFGGQNTEATPYPPITAFRRCMGQNGLPNSVLGSVSQDTHRQALAGLSWLSYSRPLDLPAVPEPGPGPAPTVTSRRLPTPAHVERTCSREQARTPWADLQPQAAAHRLWHMTAPMPRHRGLSASPPFLETKPSDRTLRLVPGIQNQGVYFSEPPSSTDKPVSGYPALLAQHMMVGLSAVNATKFSENRPQGRNGDPRHIQRQNPSP